MKVIQQNAISVDGYIAGPNHDISWTSIESWEDFINLTNETGNLVLGRVTYGLMQSAGELEHFKKIQVVALTTNDQLVEKKDNIIVTNKSPKETLKLLKEKGHKKVLIGGGGRLNASFLEAGLIDEIYLNVHPLVLTQGTPLYTVYKNNKLDLKLLNTKKLSTQVTQFHYKVIK
ncbi:dihydrofolate reductase [Candidatus Woesebacteria bacterium]|nr:dihydrofolate reductase [Candidatus Woesebacteria bacterium]